MRCIKSIKILIIIFTLLFVSLQQSIFVFTKYIYMMLISSRCNWNSFNTLNKYIFTYNKRKTIVKKKEKKLKIKSAYIFANTIIIEHAFIVDALYCEFLQWIIRSSNLCELHFIYNYGVDELADRRRSRHE